MGRPLITESASFVRAETLVKEINALCSNPYWTAERRWMIEEKSREVLIRFEELKKEEH